MKSVLDVIDSMKREYRDAWYNWYHTCNASTKDREYFDKIVEIAYLTGSKDGAKELQIVAKRILIDGEMNFEKILKEIGINED